MAVKGYQALKIASFALNRSVSSANCGDPLAASSPARQVDAILGQTLVLLGVDTKPGEPIAVSHGSSDIALCVSDAARHTLWPFGLAHFADSDRPYRNPKGHQSPASTGASHGELVLAARNGLGDRASLIRVE